MNNFDLLLLKTQGFFTNCASHVNTIIVVFYNLNSDFTGLVNSIYPQHFHVSFQLMEPIRIWSQVTGIIELG